jgi:hypothetical protein
MGSIKERAQAFVQAAFTHQRLHGVRTFMQALRAGVDDEMSDHVGT